MTHLSNEVRKYLRLRALLAFIVTFIIFSLLSFIMKYLNFYPVIISIILATLLFIQFILFVLLKPYIYQKVTKYQVHKNRVTIVEGFIFVHHKMLPLKRVQGVKVSHGIISRRYNLARLSVTTAGTTFYLPPLKMEEAHRVQKEMIALVKEEFIDV